MLPPKKSVLALTSIFLALAAQTSAHAIPKRVSRARPSGATSSAQAPRSRVVTSTSHPNLTLLPPSLPPPMDL
ncbi:hypothetical protein B0H14DRAFT_2858183 [Mycena olivaceomarginata]|nr:hypothetical protein B0H14DRAFT_2858183 [Mycena olivaceomarginata]